jgi:hypothetical protein
MLFVGELVLDSSRITPKTFMKRPRAFLLFFWSLLSFTIERILVIVELRRRLLLALWRIFSTLSTFLRNLGVKYIKPLSCPLYSKVVKLGPCGKLVVSREPSAYLSPPYHYNQPFSSFKSSWYRQLLSQSGSSLGWTLRALLLLRWQKLEDSQGLFPPGALSRVGTNRLSWAGTPYARPSEPCTSPECPTSPKPAPPCSQRLRRRGSLW